MKKYFLDILASAPTHDGLISVLENIIKELQKKPEQITNLVVETPEFGMDWDLDIGGRDDN